MRRAALLAALALATLVGAVDAPGASAYIYWANNYDGTIGRANPDGSGVNQSFISGANGFDLTVDRAHIYWTWTDCGNTYYRVRAAQATCKGWIGRANLDGSHFTPKFIVSSFEIDPYGVAVDGAHIYWTNGRSIGRANINGTGINQNFITVGRPPFGRGGPQPFGLAFDTTHIYWTNSGGATIGRANLDGSRVNQNFITGTISHVYNGHVFQSAPYGLAVDRTHIYWTNANHNAYVGTIGRANINGTGVNQNFITGTGLTNGGIAVDATHIYWPNRGSNFGGGSIGRANLNGTGVDQTFITAVSDPSGLAVDGPGPGGGGRGGPHPPGCPPGTVFVAGHCRHRFLRPPPSGCRVPGTLRLRYDKWSVRIRVTGSQGPVATQVKLGSRLMADSMSVPSILIFTKRHPHGLELSLSPCSSVTATTVVSSRLIRVWHFQLRGRPASKVYAFKYRIALDPTLGKPTTTSYLDVTPFFVFQKEFVEGKLRNVTDCEPSRLARLGPIPVHSPIDHPCARWRLALSYDFHPGRGDSFIGFDAYERLHFMPDGQRVNAGMLAHDCDNIPLGGSTDSLGDVCANGPAGVGAVPFKPGIAIFNGDNPLQFEVAMQIIDFGTGVRGNGPGIMDNLHLTTNSHVSLPVPLPPGCPECVHIHWRWGKDLGQAAFGNGNPLLSCCGPTPSPNPAADQATDLAVVNNGGYSDKHIAVSAALPGFIGGTIAGLTNNTSTSSLALPYYGTSQLVDPTVWFYSQTITQRVGTYFGWGGFFCSPMNFRGQTYGC